MLEHRSFIKHIQTQIPGFPVAVFSEKSGERTVFASFPDNDVFCARVYCTFGAVWR